MVLYEGVQTNENLVNIDTLSTLQIYVLRAAINGASLVDIVNYVHNIPMYKSLDPRVIINAISDLKRTKHLKGCTITVNSPTQSKPQQQNKTKHLKWQERLRLLTKAERDYYKAHAGRIDIDFKTPPQYRCIVCGMYFYERRDLDPDEELVCPICYQVHYEEL